MAQEAVLPNLEQERRALLASHIQRLVSTPEWDMYAQAVQAMAQRTLEGLATCPGGDVEQERGKLQGIRAVLVLPQTLIAQGKR